MDWLSTCPLTHAPANSPRSRSRMSTPGLKVSLLRLRKVDGSSWWEHCSLPSRITSCLSGREALHGGVRCLESKAQAPSSQLCGRLLILADTWNLGAWNTQTVYWLLKVPHVVRWSWNWGSELRHVAVVMVVIPLLIWLLCTSIELATITLEPTTCVGSISFL